MTNPIKSEFKILQYHIGESEPIELPFTIKKFSAGEVQIETSKPLDNLDTLLIEAFIKDADGLIALAQIKSILDKIPKVTVGLDLKYLPYSRYDRPMTGQHDAFSLKVFTALINAMQFSSVCIYDNHSDVGTALLDRCINISQEDCIGILVRSGAIDMSQYDALIIPDAGAAKKVRKVAKAFGINQVITADKTRCVKTGEITGTEVYGDVTGLNVLITDDIFDGGKTFIELGKILKARGAKSVHLYTTFGIYSKGVDILDGLVDKAFTLFPWVDNVKDTNTKGILVYLEH